MMLFKCHGEQDLGRDISNEKWEYIWDENIKMLVSILFKINKYIIDI